eukprot:3120285-Rhodomonas_salina.3
MLTKYEYWKCRTGLVNQSGGSWCMVEGGKEGGRGGDPTSFLDAHGKPTRKCGRYADYKRMPRNALKKAMESTVIPRLQVSLSSLVSLCSSVCSLLADGESDGRKQEEGGRKRREGERMQGGKEVKTTEGAARWRDIEGVRECGGISEQVNPDEER